MVTHDAGAAAVADRWWSCATAGLCTTAPPRRPRAPRPDEAGGVAWWMAIRGLLPASPRSALTGFAVVIGVAFVAGTFVFTDTIDESFKDLFERVSKGVDVNVTAKEPVEGISARPAAPQGTLEKVQEAWGRGGRGEPDQPCRSSTSRATGSGQARRSVLVQRGAGSTADLRGGPQRAGSRSTRRLRVRASRSATTPRGRPRAGRASRIMGITNIGDTSIGIQPWSCRCTRCRRSPRQPAASQRWSRPRGRHEVAMELKARSLPAGRRRRRHGGGQATAGRDISESLGFIKIALLVFAGIAVLVGTS